MTASAAELAKARSAKREAVRLYGDLEIVNGIGLSRRDGELAVRINLVEEAGAGQRFKARIAGVPVEVKVVGKIRKRASRG